MDHEEMQSLADAIQALAADIQEAFGKTEEGPLPTEREEWEKVKSTRPPTHHMPCTVRPVYHRRLERGRNGSHLDRRGKE